jgi:hypothetical protein
LWRDTVSDPGMALQDELDAAGAGFVQLRRALRAVAVDRVEIEGGGTKLMVRERRRVGVEDGLLVEGDVVVEELAKEGHTGRHRRDCPG